METTVQTHGTTVPRTHIQTGASLRPPLIQNTIPGRAATNRSDTAIDSTKGGTLVIIDADTALREAR